MKTIFKNLMILFSLILISVSSFGQIPEGYYDSADGLQGDLLRAALRTIITSGHTSNNYNNLEDDFYYTDNLGSNKVWDMYSQDATGVAPGNYYFYYNISSDQCGNYSGEGDCFNKEHSFPKSWWGGSTSAIQYADLFHLVPTDGYVNNRRSNYVFGKVSSPSWTSTNGSKVGSNTYPGYSGTVFEPIDDYKGDFARNYFYMATRYMNSFSSWSCAMISGNNYATWAINMLLEWHHNDPVSQKEIDRNNAVYSIQHNRNPYIDNPIWADAVWDPSYNPNFVELYNSFFTVSPNPASDYISIKASIDGNNYQTSVTITDISGKKIITTDLQNEEKTLDISALPTGTYFISFANNNKLVNTKKLFIVK